MRLIHLSDLHFTGDEFQARVINALCSDLRRPHAQSADALIFSGDIFSKGATSPEKVEEIEKQFFAPIRTAIGSSVPILICPGNHDVNLKKRLPLHEPIFVSANTPAAANEIVKGAGQPEYKSLWAHLRDYRDLANRLDEKSYADNPIFYTKMLKIGELTVGFACLNSAWLTRGGGHDDYGKLLIGEHQILESLHEVGSADIKIAIVHHTLDWLLPQERPAIQRALAINFDAILCGHNHDANAQSLTTNLANIFISNTGCLYQNEEYFNGYSVINYDSNEGVWVVDAREYYFQRQEFDESPRFSANGRASFRPSGGRDAIKILIPGVALQAVQERADSLLLSYSSSDVAPKTAGAIFVEPPLCRLSEDEASGERAESDFVTLRDLAKSDGPLIFLGKREAGKTSLLHHIAVNRFTDFRGAARIGIVIDLNALRRFTDAAILEQAVEFCGGEIRRKDIITLMGEGQAVVCIDNVKLSDNETAKLVTAFISRFPNPRYVLSSSEEVYVTLNSSAPVNFGVDFQKIHVHSFKRKHTRELTKRWFSASGPALNTRVALLERLLAALRVPRTPFLISVLLWVLEQRPDAHLINQATAIEVLIEGLLKKLHESKSRKEFDSTIQQHFLAEFSALLDDRDSEWVAAIDFEQFAVDYFKKRGLTVSSSGFTSELMRKGILYDGGDRVGFKFDCFRAYFLAHKFAESAARWEAAVTPENIHRYVAELDLFTGLHRDRVAVLRKVRAVCETAFSEFEGIYPLSQIDTLASQQMDIDGGLLKALEAQIFEEREAVDSEQGGGPLVRVEPKHINDVESRKRRGAHASDVGRLIETLRAFSVVLRNSELVDEVSLKRDAFRSVLLLWSTVTLAAIVSVLEALKTDNFVDEEGKSFAIPDQMKHLMRAIIPQMMISFMTESLSTPKLQLFVREQQKSDQTLIKTLSVFLALDADDEHAISMTASILQKFGGNSFVVELIFFRLIHLYFFKEVQGARFNELRSLLGTVFAKLKGGGIGETAFLKSSFLESLDKKALKDKKAT
ncbi:metallophosphoesterase [Variovorax sp. J22P271]|uniref:metallophosphoesterase n=1 Tax=Variovorax davisae TaxID=3053515 RepID=UPI0025784AB9|nr:metallophosphoesterase [Variovorax sp. J22P271]MDM0032062.1 metallophosphoesterase [Variovorax sp. J22P271]